MWSWILWAVVVLLVLGLACFTALVLVMRTKNPRGLAVVRRFNRRFTNRRTLRHAGEAGSSNDLIRHVGRRSGMRYATPIGVYPMGDDFLVYLPYGSGVDWLRNVRAAGSAELRVDGQTYVVTPEIVEPAAALPYLSAADRRVARLFRVTDFLALRRVAVGSDGAGAPAAAGPVADDGAGGTP
ncbi:nitroreductase family deazaflavin-dependent oxidoreductase [Promicromonospora sukumoe]|uniref:nitroreductase family deazaflavin-dependent oxidoreductase n=1 Tax=Promicromonospora sukumoe TaxID=88382 RepID=UPI000379C849|nr:nitroreductase family deazaflavin-dependent oxidoreductase [Promicromonospora sukumoe]